MPTLPSRFTPQSDSYTIGDLGGVMRDEVAGGLARYALDWARGTQSYSISLQLDPSQFQVWTLFYFHIIRKGSVSFYMPLDTGVGIVSTLVTMEPGSYSTSKNGGLITVVAFTVSAENAAYN
jgi:hypothetical protein